MNRHSLLAAAAAVVSLQALPAAAADGWQWQGALYGYFPDMGGTTDFPAGGSSPGVTVDAAKIIDSLKFTFMGSLEGRKGLWGVYTDVVYMDLGGSKYGTRDFSVGGLPLPGGVDGNVHYDLKGWAWTLGGTWRLASDAHSAADLVFGARMLDIDQTLRYELNGDIASLPLPGRSGESKAGFTNWDAIVGVKGRFAFGDGGKWFVPWYLDVGTGDSDLTWQAMGGVGYSFGWGDVIAAWRYLDYDMKSDQKVRSLDFNGPAIAAVFRW